MGAEEDRGKENHTEKKGVKKQEEDREELHKLEEMRERLIRGLEIHGTEEKSPQSHAQGPQAYICPGIREKGGLH